jgi:hypothetical protein
VSPEAKAAAATSESEEWSGEIREVGVGIEALEPPNRFQCNGNLVEVPPTDKADDELMHDYASQAS